MTAPRHTYQSVGFTLLEVLVAMAIFGVVAVIAYGGLAAIIDSKRGVEEHASGLASLSLAFQLMQRDLAQAVDRPVRDELGGTEEAMLLSSTGGLVFTRVGEDLPLVDLPRSRLERVEYQLRGDQLWRVRWRQLDRVQGTAADEMLLLEDLAGWQLRFLDQQGNWHQSWPPAGGAALPAALELNLEHPTWGPLRRVMLVQP